MSIETGHCPFVVMAVGNSIHRDRSLPVYCHGVGNSIHRDRSLPVCCHGGR